MDETPLLIGFVRNLGYVTLVASGFAYILEQFPKRLLKGAAIGALFALAGVVSMSDPVHLASGRIVDARVIVVVLASAYGGIVGGVICGGVLGIYRLGIGGDGALPGVIGIVLTTSLSIAFASLFQRKSRAKWLHLAAHGVIGSMPPLIFLPIRHATIKGSEQELLKIVR